MTLADKLLLGAGAKSKPYVEFVSSTAMTITPNYTNSGVTLQYSLDGTSWTTIAKGATTPSANIIYFRGSATANKRLFTSNSSSNSWVFTNSTNLEVIGNINMLIQNVLGGNVSNVPLALYCYASMFYNCTSLTVAPALPATTLASNCYYSMFYGCTSLTAAPALPATTLAVGCYSGMFYGCTSLTTAPALPATTLFSSCYYSMFYGCTMIKLSTTKTGGYVSEYRVPTVGTGIDSTNTMFNMFLGTGGTFTGTPTINTTYYTENTIV